ncbi:hypothetical protein SAY87_002478 [Trapa incisa]|uniref:Tropinone reductase-like 3 n=1 Tax=Trapa incisa TaxID=236973 RepID=A0AAN7JUU1_9MYRT|nr:hypothetical protein SAY87_002478 [Trapa incisa]
MMEDPTEVGAGAVGDENRLKYANDAGFFPGDYPPDDDSSVSHESASDSDSNCSGSSTANLATSLRLFTESMQRVERAEMDAAKSREVSRLEADRRRAELGLDMTRMVAQIQLQIAAAATGKSRKRKRRDAEDTPPLSRRKMQGSSCAADEFTPMQPIPMNRIACISHVHTGPGIGWIFVFTLLRRSQEAAILPVFPLLGSSISEMEKMKIGRRFEGKVAIVTASTQGIGYGIAERLGLEGASVVISSRKQKNVDEAVEKLKTKGIEVLGMVCHVSNSQQRKNLIAKTVEKYGKIDVIVSNAAANPSIDTIIETPESVLDKLWEINVKAPILLLKDAAPYLQKGSSLIFIASVAAYHPQTSMAMYGVTKTALLGLTKALAVEMSPDIRVNSVAPGFVPTHFADFITNNEATRRTIEENTPLNRLGKIEDMAAAVAFLASDDASYITGEILVVAGGMPSRL